MNLDALLEHGDDEAAVDDVVPGGGVPQRDVRVILPPPQVALLSLMAYVKNVPMTAKGRNSEQLNAFEWLDLLDRRRGGGRNYKAKTLFSSEKLFMKK